MVVIAQNPTFQAIDAGGGDSGFHVLEKRGEVWWLEHPWVRPVQSAGASVAHFRSRRLTSHGAKVRPLTIEFDPPPESSLSAHGCARRICIVAREIDGQPRALSLLARDLLA